MPWWRLVRASLAVTCLLAATGAMSCASFAPPPAADFIGPAGPVASTQPVGSAAATAPAASRPAAPPGPVRLTVQEAILLSLENNQALAVERLTPAIRRTYEQTERAVFDPVVAGQASMGRTQSQRLGRAGSTTEGSIVDSADAELSAGAFLPTGTQVDVGAKTSLMDSSLYSDVFASTRVGLSVTQALLRGADLRANLASLRQARLDTLASQYELRGFAEFLVAEVETAYWDYALAQRQIEIYTDSLRLAEKQLAETQERINIGRLAETELAAAQAEIALRREGLITARSDLAAQRLHLLRLLNGPGQNLWDQQLVLENQPAVPEVKLDDVEQHARLALRMRPDLNQARLQVQRGDLEIVKTGNGLLPQLDLFVTLGKTGYAEAFGRSVQNVRGDGYDVLLGIRAEYPPANREAQARHQRAVLGRRQAVEAVKNLAQIVQVDVRSAFIEVNRFREQIAATATTRKFQAEKLRAESEKLRVGRSTSLLVAAVQRDLLASQIAEIQAVVNYLKALVELHRLEGSLLARRGIAAPGREPVPLE
jgi:outer membrane protein TolC